MTVLFIILIVVILAIFYFLLIPVTFFLNLRFDGEFAQISGLRFFPFRYEFRPSAPSKKPARAKKPEIERAGGFRLPSLNFGDLETFLSVLMNSLRFLTRVVRAPDKYYLNLELVGGAGRPDISGNLYGAICALKPVLPESISIGYAPDFEATRLRGRIDCGLVIRLFSLLRELIILIYRLPKRKIIKLYWNYRKRGKDARKQTS